MKSVGESTVPVNKTNNSRKVSVKTRFLLLLFSWSLLYSVEQGQITVQKMYKVLRN